MDSEKKDAVYFYHPHMQVIYTPVVIDPSDFKPKQGILTKYGKKILAEGAKYYSTFSISTGAETTMPITPAVLLPEQIDKHKAGVAKILSRYPWLKKQ